MKRALAVVVAAACTKPMPPTPPAPPPVFDPSAALAIASDDIEFAVGASQVGATITHPTHPARYPGIIVIAGSGPTDRDWNNPLIKSTNGSGRLLGDALAAHGAVVLRFDKPGVGKNTTPITEVTADTYRDEALAALTTLRARADVDPNKLFVAGHSEGGIHAIRTALAAQPQIAGVIVLSGPGRSMADVMYTQIEKQMREAQAAGAIPAKMVDAELASFRRALDDLVAGRPMDPTKASTIPQLQQLAAMFVTPANEKFSRSIVGIDPAALVGQIAVPVLVFNGKKDIQVDPELDARHLERALKDAHRDVTLYLAEEADHVLKHETRTIDQIRGNMVQTQNDYNAADRVLDRATVDAIVAWLARVTSAKP